MNPRRGECAWKADKANGTGTVKAEGAGRSGTLYLVGTPIGNLEDMTYRAVRILGEVPLIAAEDTRHTRNLLAHFDLHTPLVSYHEHNKAKREEELIAHLRGGADLACVSDAGLPGIADPGAELAARAIEEGIPVVPVPGACAALAALIGSGMDTRLFLYVGFLPRRKAKRRALLEELSARRETLIFYEAPHRLTAFLKETAQAFGAERRIALCRELTKKFEEFKRGTIGEMIAYYMEENPRGEYVIVAAGAEESTAQAMPAPCESVSAQAMRIFEGRVAEGVERREAMRRTAREFSLPRRELYRMIEEKRE